MAVNTTSRQVAAVIDPPSLSSLGEAPRKARRRSGRQAWTRLQIRMTLQAMQMDGHPLAELTLGQITDRCCTYMRDKRGRGKKEIPSRRSFERFLSDVLAEVLEPTDAA